MPMIHFSDLKKFFIFNLIGSLVLAALVAVVTVLVGQFDEIVGRVFATLSMVVVHSIVSLVFIWDDSRNNTFDRLPFFINTIFLLVVLSFVNSIFGIWKIISWETVWHVYQTFFILVFAALHSDILSKALSKQTYLDVIIYINYVFIVVVAAMLQPIIYIENLHDRIGDFYYRLLGAVSIVDGTLSILVIIFYKLYMHQHPEISENIFQQNVPVSDGQQPKKSMSPWVWILILYLVFQVAAPLLLWIVALLTKSYY